MSVIETWYCHMSKVMLVLVMNWDFHLFIFFVPHQDAKNSKEGTNKMAKTGRLKFNLGSIIRSTPAIIIPKSEINPPMPSLHNAIISPPKAMERQTTVAIPRISGGLDRAPAFLWMPSK